MYLERQSNGFLSPFISWELIQCLSYILSTRHELNFAVNVLGTYTMTELMLPLLEKAAPDSRVITVSSGGMYTTPLTEDLQVHGLVYFSSAACLLQFSSTLWNFSLFCPVAV